jgi:hypothetical protein
MGQKFRGGEYKNDKIISSASQMISGMISIIYVCVVAWVVASFKLRSCSGCQSRIVTWDISLFQAPTTVCFTCVYATNFKWQVFIWQVLFTGVNVSTSLLWQFISSQLANHIKYSDYFDKFSLLTHTDEKNLYFDNFFYDKCTCSKEKLVTLKKMSHCK